MSYSISKIPTSSEIASLCINGIGWYVLYAKIPKDTAHIISSSLLYFDGINVWSTLIFVGGAEEYVCHYCNGLEFIGANRVHYDRT